VHQPWGTGAVGADVETIVINERVRLDKRKDSPRWQARVKLASGEWHRFSTKTSDLEEAKDAALKFYYAADERLKNNLPQNTRKFKQVAEYACERMRNEMTAGGGKVVFNDYITAINRYLIPFFGRWEVVNIDVAALQKFDTWRTEQMGRKASHSTINTHNSALNRVLDEAELRGWITSSIRPTLLNKGVKPQSRGTFSPEEYKKIYTDLRTYHEKTYHPIARETREVLRNYVLFLANTGVRHGTEALNLKWRNIGWFTKDGERYMAVYPSGKTGVREAVVRDRTVRFLDRQREMNAALADITLEEVIDAKIDDYVFKVRSGTRVDYYNLVRHFRRYLTDNNMERGPDGKQRTLYSFRHFYATQGLVQGMTSDLLSSQMGNSPEVISRFYSKLSPRMNAELLSGRAFVQNTSDDAPAKLSEVVETVIVAPVPVSELTIAAAKAFELFDAGKIGEAALLAALGVSRSGYVATEAITVRALASVETGKLSEDGLIKVLGT